MEELDIPDPYSIPLCDEKPLLEITLEKPIDLEKNISPSADSILRSELYPPLNPYKKRIWELNKEKSAADDCLLPICDNKEPPDWRDLLPSMLKTLSEIITPLPERHPELSVRALTFQSDLSRANKVIDRLTHLGANLSYTVVIPNRINPCSSNEENWIAAKASTLARQISFNRDAWIRRRQEIYDDMIRYEEHKYALFNLLKRYLSNLRKRFLTLLNFSLDFVPFISQSKAFIESSTGYNYLIQEELSDADRVLTAAGMAPVPGGKHIGKLFKLTGKILKGCGSKIKQCGSKIKRGAQNFTEKFKQWRQSKKSLKAKRRSRGASDDKRLTTLEELGDGHGPKSVDETGPSTTKTDDGSVVSGDGDPTDIPQTLSKVNLPQRIKDATGGTLREAGEFFGWKPSHVTKEASDFTKEQLLANGWTKEHILNVAEGYEHVVRITPGNPSAQGRADQLREIVSKHFGD